MLKFKINIQDQHHETIEVKYESLYLSSDATYITGITDPSYCLSEENSIIVTSDKTRVCTLEAENMMRCGYVIYNQTYEVKQFDDVVGILYEDGQYYCTTLMDSTQMRYQISETTATTLEKKTIIPSITINNVEYELYDEISYELKKSIQIPTQYWVLNNQVTINEVVYDVLIDSKTKLINDEEYYPYIILNDLTMSDQDRILYVMDWEYSKRKTVTKFKITNPSSFQLQVNEGRCVQQTNNKWENVSESTIIDLFIANNISTSLINESTQIYIRPLQQNIQLTGEKKGETIEFNYLGKFFQCKISDTQKYLNVNGVEYKIYEHKKGDSTTPYIVFNDMPLQFTETVDEKGMKGTFDDQVECFIQTYNYIIIEGKEYIVKNNTITIDNIPPFIIKPWDKIGNNILRCSAMGQDDYSDLFKEIQLNPLNFSFYIKNPIFDMGLISPLIQTTKDYTTQSIQLFINHASFLLPIKLESDVALDLHKDYLLNNLYLEEKKEEAINRIVDMEKDVYYPSRVEKKGNKEVITLCHQIQFDLHFRTRDLETWVVNDANNIHEYGGQYSSNWNIFDYYRYRSDSADEKQFHPILNLQNDNKYFLPSDLIYFLNFTNDDVFYQKQKIGKSFLRLSFYDSPNPNNHNLLYSTTIFMSETDLFQKYINADKTLTPYVTVKRRGFTKEKYEYANGDKNQITKSSVIYKTNNNNNAYHIGVDTEPCENHNVKTLTFNENKRLSSSFIIKNRNETVESSEGFYLYLFKEYSNWLHERTIYMRVQFNHAGIGKTVNFMLLYHKNSQGEKNMINWGTKFNFDKYKEGCPLNELYEHIYIEIKVKYDITNKRFCYYLPEWMSEKNSDKNVMRLSLFEIKIKDESI